MVFQMCCHYSYQHGNTDNKNHTFFACHIIWICPSASATILVLKRNICQQPVLMTSIAQWAYWMSQLVVADSHQQVSEETADFSLQSS